MNTRQISFATPEAAGATLNIPDSASRELLEMLAQVSALLLGALKIEGPGERARQDGEAEYASWTAARAGELEYASWFASPRR